MDNRYTPFGYHVEDGAISIAETEAAIIRQIFSDYIGGKSLKEIAAELTVRKVEYLPHTDGISSTMLRDILKK